ncbi:uncharacterized protein SPAPADRAFT_56576 [Spathaspora passalidarum NRRL Y-27907]|uniref:RRM domain-containing protein n=1 Tax=Spathaspora passalidarum (strain NRRL Y-27907 / 11-Y1) TaxID=619300 RepID=G3ARW7_SPAPN|nr:uncharacterized protein SPAPADRAFT_56576 [Spathaspora passalidarum NRRL Y-27907]EGW31816.1 hypothetical protein SPAPADRAFT_56576 [Spathaspora passalidarum NRRL Y-27907]
MLHTLKLLALFSVMFTTTTTSSTAPDQSTSTPTTVPKITINPNATTSNTASHQHQQEQEMLSSFTVPNPPVSTQQSSAVVAADNNTDSDYERPRTLWMGDLDPWLDEQGITDLWWNILHKRVVVKIIKPKSSISNLDPNYQGLTNSGYCFVEFETFEDAQQALSLNGQLLPDIAMPSQQHFPNNPDNQKKYFRLNWASGATLTAPIIQTPEYSLFVGDLSASTTEAHLLAFFQKSFPNSIKTVRVMTDPISGKSRCFGFVRFTDESERQRALVEMNGVWFAGRPLRVALATPRTNPRNKYEMMFIPPPPPPPPGSGQLPGQPIYPPNYYTQAQSQQQSQSQQPSHQQLQQQYDFPQQDIDVNLDMMMKSPLAPMHHQLAQPYADPTNTTVFVGGLSSEVSEPTLFTLFKPFGIIQQVKIPPGKNCGFVKYTTREEAEEAIAAMQGFIIGGNRVRLSWGRVSPTNKKYQLQQQQQQQQHQHLQQSQVQQQAQAQAQQQQMQAAAAFSMGIDPGLMGYPPVPGPVPPGPPPPPGTIPGSGQVPPPPPGATMGMMFQESSSGEYESRSNMSPPFFIPMHGPPGHGPDANLDEDKNEEQQEGDSNNEQDKKEEHQGNDEEKSGDSDEKKSDEEKKQ